MKKIINVKPITELELQFEDGKSLTLRFDVEALMHFNEMDGGMSAFIGEKSMSEICAQIIFVGGASNNQDLDINEARKIVSNMDIGTITAIINEFTEGMGTAQSEVQKELQKKLMSQWLDKIVK